MPETDTPPPVTNTPPTPSAKKASKADAQTPATNPEAYVFSDTGTHVKTTTPTGLTWFCPVDYLPTALADGYTVDAPDQA